MILQFGNRGVFVVYIIPDLGAKHRLSHSLGGLRQRIATQINI